MKKTIITGLLLLSTLENAFTTLPTISEEEDINSSIIIEFLPGGGFSVEAAPSPMEQTIRKLKEDDAAERYTLSDILLHGHSIFESASEPTYCLKKKPLCFGNINLLQSSHVFQQDLSSIKFTYTADDKEIITDFSKIKKLKEEITFKDFKEIIDEKIFRNNEIKTSYSDLISFAVSLRHLKKNNGKCQDSRLIHGDYACEYILRKLIYNLESQEAPRNLTLSNAYYQLSQVYSHIMDYNFIDWKEGKGKIYIHFVEITEVDKETISDIHSFLLKRSKYYKNNL